MNSTRLSGSEAINVDMNMDYRYFLMSNKNYYDELSTMSLLYANSIYRKGAGQEMHSGLTIFNDNNLCTIEDRDNGIEYMSHNGKDYKNLRVKEMMEHFGFQNVKTYYLGKRGDGTDNDPADGFDECRGYTDTHKGAVALGYRNIEYHGIERAVVGIVIRGTAEDDDWDCDFDMGDLELRDAIYNDENIESGKDNFESNQDKIDIVIKNIDKYDHKYNTELSHFTYGYPDWIHSYHHAGFDIVANRIMEIIADYINDDEGCAEMDGDMIFWVTGHSMGGGVANIVASELLHGTLGINNQTDNVFCYTFAAPNTFYTTDNVIKRDSNAVPGNKITEKYREPQMTKYRCIFNIVNDDDFVPKVPMEKCNWTKYGRTAKVSVNKIKYDMWSKFNRIVPMVNVDNYLMVTYQTNPILVDLIIACFNGVFDDTSEMRKETYSYKNRNGSHLVIYPDKESLEDGLAMFASPYQKNTYNSFVSYIDNSKRKKQYDSYIQYQMPAYIMQSMANTLHEYIYKKEILNGKEAINRYEDPRKDELVNTSKLQFINARMSFNSLGAKWATLISEGVFKVIDSPHLPESYYKLTKYVSTIDFQ